MIFQYSLADIGFSVGAGFLVGILAASLSWDIGIILLVMFFGGGAWLWIGKRLSRSWMAVITVMAIACILGAFYYHFYLNQQASKTGLPFGQKVLFSAVVSDEPRPSDTFEVLTVTPKVQNTPTLTVFAGPGDDFHYGDLLQIEGTVSPPRRIGDDPAIFPKRLTLVAKHQGFLLREILINLKASILAKFNTILPSDEAALLGGIAFGSKVNFKSDLKNAMALSGTTHLVAISGYNITIVIIATRQIFGRFLSRRKTFYCTIACIVLFVLMTGLQASAVRAAVMGFLALFAQESGRLSNMRNAITLTAAGMAIIDPTIVTQNAGFALSFLSLMGIVYLGPSLKAAFHYKDSGILDWKESAVTTLSAQLAVMPVLIAVFGQFSATAILANILILGTVPLTMFFGFLLAVLSFLSYYLAFFTAKIVGLSLAYQLSVIRLFAVFAIPLPLAFNSTWSFGVYYSALALFIYSHAERT